MRAAEPHAMNEEIEHPSEEREPQSVTRRVGGERTSICDPRAVDRAAHDDEADAGAWAPGSTLPFVAPAPPQQLGRYVVLRTLGRGGMGTVLEAFDRTLDRRVALKVLHRDLEQEHAKRLVREAQALAKLSHPHVVQVYEVGEAAGQAFIAMELVQGRSLRAWLDGEPRPGWRESVQVFLQAGEGLAAAHARGLVHRDFKPGNAVIDDDGRVRVLDFGLARWVEDADEAAAVVDASMDVAAQQESLTQAGMVMGTPAYMAPEQMRGHEVDARTDQFAYCVALFEALYAERPFPGGSMAALMVSLLSGQVRPAPRGSDVPATLRAAVLRGLAVAPADRWPSMDALLGELRRIVAPPRKRGVAALGVAGGLVVVGLGLWQQAAVGQRCDGARQQLAGTWDAARKQEVQAAILATELSYAADTWARVEERLDTYTDAWTRAHTEVCEATSVRQEQSADVMDLRMACLGERRLALREAVEVLARADATRVEHAVELVASLPGLSRCDDVRALAAELPPPEDAQVAARVEALRARLARARALRDAGVYDEALDEADAVVQAAETLEYPPLLAEAFLARANAHDSTDRVAEAEADAERAYLLAMEHGHVAVEARAGGRLLWLVGERQARHDAGLQWGKAALAKARSVRAEPRLEASTLDDVGAVLWRQGKLTEALDHHQRALALFERELDPRHPEIARTLNDIGNVLWAKGQLDQALAFHQRAATIWEEALGASHPSVARALNNIGTVLKDRGEGAAG
jgi:eukaryotic-like serine/threonine-protein kinase